MRGRTPPAGEGRLGRGQPRREGILGFVVGGFGDDDDGGANPEPTGASVPVIESLVHVPPSAIDASGVSGPVSEGKAIYLVARRPDNGALVASTTARLSQPSEGEELHWRALLDLRATTLSSAVKSDEAPVSYELVAAVLPELRSRDDSGFGLGNSVSSYGNNLSTNASAGDVGLDLDDAEAVSAPRTVKIPGGE
jgi:hypothetical protein